MTKKKMLRLEQKFIPVLVSQCYSVFIKLARTSAGLPIRFSEIKAWSDLTGYELSEIELDAIQRFDSFVINKRNALAKHFRDMEA
jgi:hypothetical protein